MIGTGQLDHQNLPFRLLRLALVAAALALTAYWLTRLAAPRPVAVLPTPAMPAQSASPAALLRVFGIGAGQAADTAGIELTGLYAGADGRGFATFRTPRGPVSGIAGDEIQPGIRLRALAAGHVILAVGGGERRLELPAPPSTTALPSEP